MFVILIGQLFYNYLIISLLYVLSRINIGKADVC